MQNADNPTHTLLDGLGDGGWYCGVDHLHQRPSALSLAQPYLSGKDSNLEDRKKKRPKEKLPLRGEVCRNEAICLQEFVFTSALVTFSMELHKPGFLYAVWRTASLKLQPPRSEPLQERSQWFLEENNTACGYFTSQGMGSGSLKVVLFIFWTGEDGLSVAAQGCQSRRIAALCPASIVQCSC